MSSMLLPPYSIIREKLNYIYQVIEEALEATADKWAASRTPSYAFADQLVGE